MKNTSEKKKKEPSKKKSQLTEIEIPQGHLLIDCRIKDIERPIFEDEKDAKRIHYRALLKPSGAIHTIYNGRNEACSTEDLKNLDPKANIFKKSFRRYFIQTYGQPEA